MSERGLTSAMSTAVAAGGTYRPVMFFEGEYVASGSPSNQAAYLRLFSGIGPLAWDGKTWTGGGNFLSFSKITETRDVRAVGFGVRLSGMPSDIVALALSNVRLGRAGRLWLGLYDASGSLIADPGLMQEGVLDRVSFSDSGDTGDIVAQYESRLIELNRPRARFYTPEDQRIDYPADEGLAFVASIQSGLDIAWDV